MSAPGPGESRRPAPNPRFLGPEERRKPAVSGPRLPAAPPPSRPAPRPRPRPLPINESPGRRGRLEAPPPAAPRRESGRGRWAAPAPPPAHLAVAALAR